MKISEYYETIYGKEKMQSLKPFSITLTKLDYTMEILSHETEDTSS